MLVKKTTKIEFQQTYFCLIRIRIYIDVIFGNQKINLFIVLLNNMNSQKHKSIRPNPGVKRIQNYLFKFCDFLGKGNFSSVYKGINQLTKDTVAIKYIALSSLTCERLKQLLDQEIEILTSLSHPSIVKCFEVLKSAHNCYIITELCDGGDLQGLLKKKRTLTEEQMIPYIRDIFEGLYYLSKKNIVHRDIKIANIFLSKGKAKIADFGFAQRAKKQFNDGKIGTPLCMSPQGFLQNLYGCKTDVWAFGMILYHLSHGRLPLEHCTTEEMLRQNIQVQLRIDQLKPQLSPQLKELIIKCLDVNPCSRITFQEMRNCAFIRKITGDRIQTFSLQDLKYAPTLLTRHSEEPLHQESFVVSLKTLDDMHFNQLANKQKIESPNNQVEPMSLTYGTNKICEDLKPQNRVQKIEKQQEPLIVRPLKLQTPTVRIIPLKREEAQSQGEQNPVIIENPFEENEEFEIKIGYKSHTTLPSQSTQICLNPSQKDEKSVISTTDRQHLEIPQNPATFKRRQVSFQMTSAQQRQVQKLNVDQNIRPTSSRQPIEAIEIIKRQKTGIDICPVTNTKRLLNGFMRFNEAIGMIHYCRLMYKYIAELKSTGIYHAGDLNLRYYSNYLLNLLNELVNKITSDHIILTKTLHEQENKDNKVLKMKKVIEEYIERYKPNLEKERGDYLNRTTGQIKQIAQLDQRFIQTFYIPDKIKLEAYNAKLVKFSEILEKCSRYQRYTQFDSNKELEESTKEEKRERPVFAQRSQNIQYQSKDNLMKTQVLQPKFEPMQRRTSIQLQQNIPLNITQRKVSFQQL